MEFGKKFMPEKTEELNDITVMLGVFALIGGYYFTGEFVPGIL